MSHEDEHLYRVVLHIPKDKYVTIMQVVHEDCDLIKTDLIKKNGALVHPPQKQPAQPAPVVVATPVVQTADQAITNVALLQAGIKPLGKAADLKQPAFYHLPHLQQLVVEFMQSHKDRDIFTVPEIAAHVITQRKGKGQGNYAENSASSALSNLEKANYVRWVSTQTYEYLFRDKFPAQPKPLPEL